MPELSYGRQVVLDARPRRGSVLRWLRYAKEAVAMVLHATWHPSHLFFVGSAEDIETGEETMVLSGCWSCDRAYYVDAELLADEEIAEEFKVQRRQFGLV